jgi:photosystem II stability/assembly factor-like uncharacterized protein
MIGILAKSEHTMHQVVRHVALSTLLASVATLAAVSLGIAAEDEESKGGPAEFKMLKFRLIGPAVGGRVSRAAGVPGDPLVYYAATASGGVWKSSDGGIHWKPLFDEQPISSTGALAIAPSEPNVLYVGSGEANIRGNVAAGNGIYKSTDAGKTWKQVWRQEGQIGAMAVHPTNPDICYAAVLGRAFGPNPERGVYRTSDGGKTWQKVLYKNPDTGASDVCLDPSNPRIVFAGLWQARRRPWELQSGGPGSGLYLSRDGGDTWTQLIGKDPPPGTPGKGLPEGIWGKIGVAVAPSDGRRIYALVEAENGGLYRSDDGGETWSLVNGHHILRQRAWYYSTLTVDPHNPDVVWCPQVPMLRSIDGGKTFKRVKGIHHGDNHDAWIDPKNPKRIIVSNDGGVDISLDGGETWFAPRLPIAQFYHIAVDNALPYHASGAMQDLGTAEGPSNSLIRGGISNNDWYDIGGGEAGHTAHDPTDPDIVYAGEYGGYITRYNHRTRQANNISIYPYNPSGHGGEDLRFRFQWTAPILVSPHNPKVIYHAANVLFRTEDGGAHWQAISPDLTRNDKSKQKWSGGPITGDNTGVEVYCTIFAIAESPKQPGLLWAGSDDGLVHVSVDGGKKWTNVTANIPNLSEWGTVSCIEPSPFDASTAYLVVDAHRLDDGRPFLYKTTDLGRTWKNLAGSLPKDIYLHAVREDPKVKGLLYLGTERGLAFSRDDGGTWTPLKLNFPTVAVHDLMVKNDDLVVGTHGRSVWIFDDLNSLRQFSPSLSKSEAHIFQAKDAIQFRYATPLAAESIGKNPPEGAILDYFLPAKPKGVITLEVRDAKGATVASFKSKPEKKQQKPDDITAAFSTRESEEEDSASDDPDEPDERPKKPNLTAKAGVNRFAWDLRYDGAKRIRGAKLDLGFVEYGPLVLPGSYTLRLTVDGKVLTGPLTVKADPRITTSVSYMQEQLQMALQVRDDLNRLANLVNRIRSIKKQLLARHELLKGEPAAKTIDPLDVGLYRKLDALEEKLHNPRATVTYDILAQRGGAKLYSQLGALFEYLKEGCCAPTQGMREVYAEEASDLKRLGAEVDTLLAGEVAKLNEVAKGLAIPNIVVPAAVAPAK